MAEQKIAEFDGDVTWPPRSQELGELFGALAAAQSTYEVAKPKAKSSFVNNAGQREPYTFADLPEVLAAALPSLNKNEISLSQYILRTSEKERVLITCLGHKSGQYIESRMVLAPTDDWLAMGKGIAYARRHSFASLAGVVAEHEDNDANEEILDEGVPAEIFSTSPAPTITQEQYEHLNIALNDNKGLAKDICRALRIDRVKDIPRKSFNSVIAHINKVNTD